ncbi:MAG: LptF/LptG family permease [Asticcacaulis sp.]
MSLGSLLERINPWRNRRLETYILRQCLITLGGTLAIISSVIFLIDYVEVSKNLGQKADLTSIHIIGLLLLKSPNVILILLPFVFLFGTLGAFVSLNRRSELVAMRAAGVSAWRFVLPASGMAFLIGILTISVLNPVASLLGDRYDQVQATIEGKNVVANGDGGIIYLRQGEGNKQTVIRAKIGQSGNELTNATFWTYVLDSKGTPQFESRIDAQQAILKPGTWQLKGAREAFVGEPVREHATLSLESSLNPHNAFHKRASPQSTPFWKLPLLIRQIESSGFTAAPYILRLHQLLATPVMFAAMAGLGAVFSLRLMRLGGMARLAVSGVGLGFAVFFVNQLCGAMGKAEVIPIFLAGWATPVLALLSAMTLLVYTEDG